ncbi:MAG TPA: hypothetical protein VLA58_09350, partial [Chitinophagaceae bacterium]|nr:hypothetical protein [Chitinophagaceae bacterium]
MSKCILSLVIFFLPVKDLRLKAQHLNPDSLKRVWTGARNDTVKMIVSGKLASYYAELNPDSSYRYANEMLGIANRLNLPLERAHALGASGYALINVGNYPRSLQILLTAAGLSEDPESEKNILPAYFEPSDEYTDRSADARMQRLTRLSKILQYLGILYSN